jgi:hypothetical protein
MGTNRNFAYKIQGTTLTSKQWIDPTQKGGLMKRFINNLLNFSEEIEINSAAMCLQQTYQEIWYLQRQIIKCCQT